VPWVKLLVPGAAPRHACWGTHWAPSWCLLGACGPSGILDSRTDGRENTSNHACFRAFRLVRPCPTPIVSNTGHPPSQESRTCPCTQLWALVSSATNRSSTHSSHPQFNNSTMTKSTFTRCASKPPQARINYQMRSNQQAMGVQFTGRIPRSESTLSGCCDENCRELVRAHIATHGLRRMGRRDLAFLTSASLRLGLEDPSHPASEDGCSSGHLLSPLAHVRPGPPASAADKVTFQPTPASTRRAC
jgi:hypothetical protein